MEKYYLKFVFALIAAGIVVSISIILSQYFSNSQFNSATQNLQQVQQNLQNLGILSIIGNSNSTVSCALLKSGLATLSSEMAQLGQQAQLADYENQSGPQYSQLVDQLSYARIEYWLLVQRINSQCNYGLTTLLLLYKPQNCQNCVLEGQELSYLQTKDSNITPVALDGQWNLQLIDSLNGAYNLTQNDYPVVIINSKYIVKGYLTTPQIISDLCKYTNKTEFCNSSI